MRIIKSNILFIIVFLLISTASFSIFQNTIIPVYLEIPEYLKITHLSKGRLDLYADINDKNKEVSDSLSFFVESNISYNLGISFSKDPVFGEYVKDKDYNITVKNENGETIINKKAGDLSENNIASGSKQYDLTFILTVTQKILDNMNSGVGNKIGDITITVSSI